MLGAFHNGVIATGSVPSAWRVHSGSYTGTGSALSMTGLGFRPQLIILKDISANATADPIIGWSGMTTSGGATPAATIFDPSSAPATNIITGYDSDGFTVGTNTTVNTAARTYNYVAIAGSSAEVITGNYVGDGTDDRDISIGGTPRFLFVRRRNSTTRVVLKMDTMPTDESHGLGAAAVFDTDQVQDIISGGFRVGTNAAVNNNTSTYDYIALSPPTTGCTMGTYVGNGSDNRNITGIGFSPTWVFIKNNNNQSPVMRGTTNVGDTSNILTNSIANTVNLIQSLGATSFQVGDSSRVNASPNIYYYIALRS